MFKVPRRVILAGSLFAAFALLQPSASSASGLVDAQGNIYPEYLLRCPSQAKLTPQQCSVYRDIARRDGCINDAEHALAARLGLLVGCDRLEIKRVFMACPCSCFHPSTKILANLDPQAPRWVPVTQIESGVQVASVGDGATIPALRLQSRNVVYATSGPEESDLLEVTADEGRSKLAVTQFHAVLLNDGTVVAAHRLRVGDILVRADGQPAPVVSIVPVARHDDVFNFLVESDELAAHLVVAENVVVGDLLWQNTLDADAAAVSLRR